MNQQHNRRQIIKLTPEEQAARNRFPKDADFRSRNKPAPRPTEHSSTPEWRQFKTHKVIIEAICDSYQSIARFYKCWADTVACGILFILFLVWFVGSITQDVQNAKREHMRQEIKDGLNAYYGTDIKLTPQEEAILNNVSKNSP